MPDMEDQGAANIKQLAKGAAAEQGYHQKEHQEEHRATDHQVEGRDHQVTNPTRNGREPWRV